ncbi:MAG: type II secretion system ATPase GspE [Bdellovibrionales bacterium]|nr:type II secretion system ATPase GspE [Bdellovibrionales bacterium]
MNIKSILLKNTKLSELQVTNLLKLEGPLSGLNLSQDKSSKSIQGKILKALSEQLSIPFIEELNYNEISADLIKDIPIQYAKNNSVLAFKKDNDGTHVISAEAFNSHLLSDLKNIFNTPIHFYLSSPALLQEAINHVYEKNATALEAIDGIEDEEMDLDDPIIDLLESDDDAPVVKFVNTLLARAVKEKASDIHIEPYEKKLAIRFRIDGALYDVSQPPKRLQNSIASRIKVMANLDIAEKRMPQDGRFPLKVAGKAIDIRLSTLPTTFGERIVMRLQDQSNTILKLSELGVSKNSLKDIKEILNQTYGIFLVTGPTGSGKTSTLYAALSQINSIDKNILTIEEPVEQRIPGVGQMQVNSKIGLSFASGLRSILRQDPNVIMIGEIRDLETAKIAIQSSLTGHLVLSTIHTNDAASAFPRLMDMGCEPFLIATSLSGIMAQRLIRTLCKNCKEAYQPTDNELADLQLSNEQTKGVIFYKAKSCPQCNHKGYIGRTMIQELLLVTDNIRSLIMQKNNSSLIKAAALKDGMQTFRDHGITKILEGVTTIEEILTNTQVDH